MATLLKTWYTYYARSGTGTPNSVGDGRGRVDVYLESQNYANNTSYIRIDHKAHFIKSNAATLISYNVTSSYRANQGSYGGTYQTFQTPAAGYVSSVPTSSTEYTKTIDSSYHTVYHNADGTGTLYVNGSIEFDPLLVVSTNYYATKSSSFSVALPTIPKTANITSFYNSAQTINSLSFVWTTDAAVDALSYSLNGGGWVSAPVSSPLTISGLSAGTQYSVAIAVKRTDSQLWTYSSTIYATTLYNPTNVTSFFATPNPIKEKGTATLSWSGATTPQGSIDWFDIHTRKYNGSTWTAYTYLKTVYGWNTTHKPIDTYPDLKSGDIIQYKIFTHNTSGGYSTGIECVPTLSIILNSSCDIKVAGTYKGGKPWIKISGTWRKGTFWTKVGGTWKTGI